MEIPVTKYHGCGNDFVLMHESDVKHIDPSALAVEICNRNTGIGADGMILAKQNPLTMLFYNADGSMAPMCGNGIRCFARFCKEEGLASGEQFAVLTGDGVKKVEVTQEFPFQCRIFMGQPKDDPKALGMSGKETLWDHELTVQGRKVTLCSLFLATVHTVWFVEDAFDDALLPLAREIHQHPFFPLKTNVNLVQVIDQNTIRMRTWERGVGLTLACGTGACASVLTAYQKGLCAQNVTVELAKGKLEVEICDDESVYMTGPAQRVFKGGYFYEA